MISQISIREFLIKENIPHYAIWYYISTTTGKKTPIGEKNNEPLECVMEKQNINPQKPSRNFDENEMNTLQKAYSIFVKYTDNIYCVDVDDPEIHTMDEFIEKTGYDIFKNSPWVKGNTKGIHIYIKINNMVQYSNQQNVFNGFTGDLIKKNNMWERMDKTISNYCGEISLYDFDEIKHIFNDRLNHVQTIKIKIKKHNKGVEEQKENFEEEKEETINDDKNLKNIEIENLISCFSETRATEYEDWLKVMFMIANELGINGENLFLKFSKKSKKFNDNDDEQKKINEQQCVNKYREYIYKQNKLVREKKITIGSGHLWAKTDNETLYFKLFPKNVTFKNDDECGTYIYNLLKDDIICCNNQIFMKINNVWKHNIDYLNTYLTDFVMKQNIYKRISEDKKVQYWRDYNRAVNVVKTVINKIKLNSKNNLYDLFHSTTKGRLCFIDGVLDFKTKSFYKWEDINFKYFSTVQIPVKFHDYFHNPDLKNINEIKNTIFEPLFGKKMDLALKFFSRAFAGHCEDKNFATYLGNRDCGKGILFLLFLSFGDYLKPLSLDNVLCSRATDKKAQKSVELFWLLELEFCRLAFSQETPEVESGLKINTSLFKKLVSGGDVQTARRNYDREDTKFTVDFTPFMAGNNSLDLDGDVKEHLIEFESIVRFISAEEIEAKRRFENEILVQNKYRVKDPELKAKCQTLDWQLATIYLIYMNYTETALNVGIKDLDMEEVEETLISQFLEDYEITNNQENIIPVEQIKTRSYGHDWKKLKGELEGIKLIIKKCKKETYRDKICCFGIKKRL